MLDLKKVTYCILASRVRYFHRPALLCSALSGETTILDVCSRNGGLLLKRRLPQSTRMKRQISCYSLDLTIQELLFVMLMC